MKRNVGIYLILISIILASVGTVLKLQHLSGADLVLAIGTIALIIGFAIILYKLYQKRSS